MSQKYKLMLEQDNYMITAIHLFHITKQLVGS